MSQHLFTLSGFTFPPFHLFTARTLRFVGVQFWSKIQFLTENVVRFRFPGLFLFSSFELIGPFVYRSLVHALWARRVKSGAPDFTRRAHKACTKLR